MLLNMNNAVIGLISSATLGILFFCGIFFALPQNVLTSSQHGNFGQLFTKLMPQGWVFGSGAPGGPETIPYRIDDEIFSASVFPNAKPGNFFGASRRQRAQLPEVRHLSAAAQDWVECDDLETEQACLLKTSESIVATTVKNNSPVPTLCADILLSETVPVPWSERTQHNVARLPTRATYLKVECP